MPNIWSQNIDAIGFLIFIGRAFSNVIVSALLHLLRAVRIAWQIYRVMMNDKETLAQRAHRDIRTGILEGQFAPGERLVLRSLARSLDMSLAPVGEALRELAHEGLIEMEPRWGARVIKLDPDTVRSQHILRTAIECEAARHCALYALDIQHQEILGLASELDQVAHPASSSVDIDCRFHLLIAQHSGIPSLYNALYQNRFVPELVRASRVRIQDMIDRGVEFEGKDYLAGPRHIILAEAIQSRDPELAARIMRTHCEESMQFHILAIRMGDVDVGNSAE